MLPMKAQVQVSRPAISIVQEGLAAVCDKSLTIHGEFALILSVPPIVPELQLLTRPVPEVIKVLLRSVEVK